MLTILIPTSLIEYSLSIIFLFDFFLLGDLLIPGNDTQLFKKNNTTNQNFNIFFALDILIVI